MTGSRLVLVATPLAGHRIEIAAGPLGDQRVNPGIIQAARAEQCADQVAPHPTVGLGAMSRARNPDSREPVQQVPFPFLAEPAAHERPDRAVLFGLVRGLVGKDVVSVRVEVPGILPRKAREVGWCRRA